MFAPIAPWTRYGLSLLVPLATFGFLVSVPHAWPGWLAVFATLLAFALRDGIGGDSPQVSGGAGASVTILVAAGALHLANAILLVVMVGRMALVDAALAVLLVGIGTAYAAGIVGHEMVHRASRGAQLMGRLLLWPALYDHFAVEHVRGHHVRVATHADPTTARFGETIADFAIRSLVGQLAGAWHLDRRAVLVGLVGEALVLGVIAVMLGATAVTAWLLQAVVASVIITAVNYFDHWGLQRSGRRFTAEDAWDCDSSLSHYVLLALPRHADHHLHAARPFDRLGPTHASPKLPHGYVRMVFLVLFANAAARRLLTDELRRRGLGPFRGSAMDRAA